MRLLVVLAIVVGPGVAVGCAMHSVVFAIVASVVAFVLLGLALGRLEPAHHRKGTRSWEAKQGVYATAAAIETAHRKLQTAGPAERAELLGELKVLKERGYALADIADSNDRSPAT
ncbi:MAG: hypothetical protein QM831_43445 [Kofleriaceae bacterium]